MNHIISLFIAALLAVSASASADSLRLASGKLLETGMPRAQLLLRAGSPLDKSIERYGVNTASNVETWTYIIEGSVGGPRLVEVELVGGVVTAITSTQVSRAQ